MGVEAARSNESLCMTIGRFLLSIPASKKPVPIGAQGCSKPDSRLRHRLRDQQYIGTIKIEEVHTQTGVL